MRTTRSILAANGGALNVMASNPPGEWTLLRPWTAEVAIQATAASPPEVLVLVDADHRATQFNIEEGRPGGMRLGYLGPRVDDVTHSVRRLARAVPDTALGASANFIRRRPDLVESTLVPKPLNGSRLSSSAMLSAADPVGARFYLPDRACGRRFIAPA